MWGWSPASRESHSRQSLSPSPSLGDTWPLPSVCLNKSYGGSVRSHLETQYQSCLILVLMGYGYSTVIMSKMKYFTVIGRPITIMHVIRPRACLCI